MTRRLIGFAVSTVCALGLLNTAAAAAGRSKIIKPPPQQRDCTPINGRYGYYGNPWCDADVFRINDLRQRARKLRVKGELVR